MLAPLSRPTLLLLSLAACAQTGDLTLAEDWTLVPADADPVQGRPADAEPCPQRALAIEAGAPELDTALCDWVTATAPAQLDLRAGTGLELFLFHQALSAAEPAQAVMEVRVGEQVLWRQVTPVPSASAFHDEVVILDERLRAGDPVLFHVHNHGANTYTLGHLRAP